MRIIHIISGGDTGGAKTHLLTLLKELNKTSEYCELLCIMEGKFTEDAKSLKIPVTVLEQRNRFDLLTIYKIKKYIAKNNFDIIHCHGARANFIAAILKFYIKVPFVTTMHSDYKLDFINDTYKKTFYTPINRLALSRFDYYLAVTEDFTKMLINRGFAKSKIFTIYNGIDLEEQHKIVGENEFLEKYNIKYDVNCVYVGLVARLHSVKGIEVFLNMAKELLAIENLVFLIAGTGEEEKKFKDYASINNITNVKFLGHVDDIYSFYNVIDINTLTSLSESFPYALLEGGFMKKATIASSVGGIPEMITHEVDGLLFDKEDYKQMAQQVAELSKSRELQIKYGDNFYNKIVQQFSSVEMARLHISIYKTIRGEL